MYLCLSSVLLLRMVWREREKGERERERERESEREREREGGRGRKRERDELHHSIRSHHTYFILGEELWYDLPCL